LWSGTQYVVISSSLALGETSTTAYRGDRGKIAYDYSQVGHLPLAGGTITNDLTVGGNLTVSGTTTTIDTETVGIKDNLILINSNQTGTPNPAVNPFSGLEIERGDLTNFQFVFDENDDRFKVGQVGSLQTVATRTDDGTIANRGITFFNTSTNRLENNANIVISSDNRVGIGTSTTSQMLDVLGNINIGGSENYLTFNNGDMQIQNTPGYNMTFHTYTGSAMTEKMRITSAGNVGIGTTTASITIDSGTSVLSKQVVRLDSTGTTISSQAPTLTLVNDASVTQNQMSRLAFGSRSGLGTAIISADITAVYTGDGSGNGRSTDLVFGTTLQTVSQSPSERMRITSGGNVGIGTTTTAININSGATVLSKVAIRNDSASTTRDSEPPTLNLINDSSVTQNQMSRLAFSARSGLAAPIISADITAIYVGDSSGNGRSSDLVFGTSLQTVSQSPIERMRITSDGNVGIGIASPLAGAKLTVSGGYITQTNGTINTYLGSDGTGSLLGTSTNHYLRFTTNDTERVIIKADGEVIIGNISDQGDYNLQVGGTGVWGGGAYVNGSDRRLKTNINAIQTGLDVIEKLNPVTFNYIEEYSKDKTLQTGFIAQEMLEAMSGKDYVDSIVQKGKEFYGVAYQSLIPILVKAIQELTKRVEELESK
jgi:hypothetical protein